MAVLGDRKKVDSQKVIFAISLHLMVFKAHCEAPCSNASEWTSQGPPGACHHSRWGHLHTQWRITSPRE